MSVLRPHHGGNLAWAAAQAGCRPQEILDFSASINPLGPPPSVLEAIAQHLGDIQAYPDPSATVLREQLSHFHRVPLEWVMVGNGAAELLTWACRSLGEMAWVHLLTPAFGDYWRALKSFNAKVRPHALSEAALHGDGAFLLQDWMAVDPSDLGPDAGLLLNNPHNPTGHLFQKSDVLKWVRGFRRVAIDEAFMDFLPSQDRHSFIPEIANYPHVVVLRSLTKFYSIPGLRLGYAIGHPDLLRQWQSWRDPWSVNALAIAAGVAAIRDEAFQAQTYRWLAGAIPQMREGLAQRSGLSVIPGSVNFALVRCNGSATKLQERLLKQYGILIRDCTSFPELGDRYFRVAVRTAAENERLLAAL
ncbi:threonine-phosphate decarboxylase CobD [Altericista sp. CCNU0014]|uniref:threonine-phosphate decarboxylase CobD n=1 Tax=Altericista sp. CCNU0014 TaxID=3082949 RepID=UPI00384FB46C